MFRACRLRGLVRIGVVFGCFKCRVVCERCVGSLVDKRADWEERFGGGILGGHGCLVCGSFFERCCDLILGDGIGDFVGSCVICRFHAQGVVRPG